MKDILIPLCKLLKRLKRLVDELPTAAGVVVAALAGIGIGLLILTFYAWWRLAQIRTSGAPVVGVHEPYISVGAGTDDAGPQLSWSSVRLENLSGATHLERIELTLLTPYEGHETVMIDRSGRERIRLPKDSYSFQQGRLDLTLSGALQLEQAGELTVLVSGTPAKGAQGKLRIEHISCEPHCMVIPEEPIDVWFLRLLELTFTLTLATAAWFVVLALYVRLLRLEVKVSSPTLVIS